MNDQHQYPESYAMETVLRAPNVIISVPGSKSITNRALVLAALCQSRGPVTLEGVLQSEDTELMVAGLQQLGYHLETIWDSQTIRLSQTSSPLIPANSAAIFTGNSGTTMRFLTALVAAGKGRYRLDGVARMRERPIQDLLDALNQLPGVNARSEAGNGCPPVVIESNGWDGGIVRVRSAISSQFLSALLLVAPFGNADTTIEVESVLVSEPYVAMTVAMLNQWGCQVEASEGRYSIKAGQPIQSPETYQIEPDASAASYPLAAAAITGGRVTVQGMKQKGLQGDAKFAELLERMGCRVEWCEAGVTVHGRSLHGIDVDMNAVSDTVMTLAAVACFADSPTTIRNVAHIRHKETDRISALAKELRRLGIKIDEFADGLTIHPGPMQGASLETYNDHRMAMSLAMIGLKVPGVVIKNPGCVAKTYPNFWSDLEFMYM